VSRVVGDELQIQSILGGITLEIHLKELVV